jgi:hypothetical protein
MEEKDLLLKVYIGQGINYGRGILYKFRDEIYFNDKENKIIKSLSKKKLVDIIYPYSIKSILTLVTTKSGTELSIKIMQEILDKDSKLIDELNQIPKKVLGFLLINLDNLTPNKTKENWVFDWKEFILNSKKMFDFSIKFCEILKMHKLAILTNDYVSSKGGRIDPEKYVIPNEVKEYLITNLKPIRFSDEEVNKSILFYTIHKIKQDILDIKDDARRRSNFWNLLQVLPFDESSIKLVIDKFKEEHITTKYSKIDNEQFLFSVLDKSRFDIKLNKLVCNFLSEVYKGEKKEPKISLRKAPPLLKTHAELFILIGNFETKFRNYLLNEMRTMFKGDEKEWYNQLKKIKLLGDQMPFKTIYDKLVFRENEDLKNKILPEDELIYYADIIDYMNIILKDWKIFENKFNKINLDREKFEHGMNELNKIRKKVMHLRDIRLHEAKTIRLYIIPELEKIFL